MCYGYNMAIFPPEYAVLSNIVLLLLTILIVLKIRKNDSKNKKGDNKNG